MDLGRRRRRDAGGGHGADPLKGGDLDAAENEQRAPSHVENDNTAGATVPFAYGVFCPTGAPYRSRSQTEPDYLQVDHLRPRSKGGAHVVENRTLLCDSWQPAQFQQVDTRRVTRSTHRERQYGYGLVEGVRLRCPKYRQPQTRCCERPRMGRHGARPQPHWAGVLSSLAAEEEPAKGILRRWGVRYCGFLCHGGRERRPGV